MLIYKNKGSYKLSTPQKIKGGSINVKSHLTTEMTPNNPIFGLVRPRIKLDQFSGSSISSVNFGPKTKSNIKFII